MATNSSTNSTSTRNTPMKWTEQHDVMLCREILLIQPHKHRPKSTERGNAWTSIASDLNAIQELRFTVTQKAVRDRFKLLIARFKRKTNEEAAASGICPEESELDQALETIVELMSEAEQQYDKDSYEKQKKLETDRKNAEELRAKAMETFGESRKRQSDTEESQASNNRKKRATGGETLVYLQNKAEQEFEIRKAELECKNKEMEGNKEAELSMQKQQQQQFMEFQKTMMEQCQHQQAMMQQQMQQQALRHQQMMASQAQQQQQNNQLLLVLLEKLTKS